MAKRLKSSSYDARNGSTYPRGESHARNEAIRRAGAPVRLSIFPPFSPPSRSNAIDLYVLPVIPLALLSRGNNSEEGDGGQGRTRWRTVQGGELENSN